MRTLTVSGHIIGLQPKPPPHVLFLASKMTSDPTEDTLRVLSRAGGLSALLVASIDGEPVVVERKLPRDLPALEALGEAFIMAAFDVFGSWEALTEALTAIHAEAMGAANLNPT